MAELTLEAYGWVVEGSWLAISEYLLWTSWRTCWESMVNSVKQILHKTIWIPIGGETFAGVGGFVANQELSKR